MRVLMLLEILQSRRYVAATTLVSELEVSLRTVQRFRAAW
jgi:predicted DNA-binding transcriptional regulator YafY